MKEKTIATFTKKNYRLQMLKITAETIPKNYQPETQTDESLVCVYEIRKNRRILAKYKNKYLAEIKFATIIYQEILQQKITF